MNKTLKYLIIITLAFCCQDETFSQRRKAITPESEVIKTNPSGAGLQFIFNVTAGKSHNYPMMAAWLEDAEGHYIQTLYVNQSVAKGYFNYADRSEGKWKPGALIRPASLPVWAHKRGVPSGEGHFMPTQENPVPDAYTSATPKGDFLLKSKSDGRLTGKIRVFFEVNQSWDWNEYWTNNKYPDEDDYKTSAQPSVVYSVEIDPDNLSDSYLMEAIGHGHYSGKNGDINPDLSTITTALQIFETIEVKVEK
jgi:hypothetical protein